MSSSLSSDFFKNLSLDKKPFIDKMILMNEKQKLFVSNKENIFPPVHLGDAGYDIVAATDPIFGENYVEYGTGLKIQPPENCVVLAFPRSSISKMDLVLANSVGVIDNGYRGEIKIRFKLLTKNLPTLYKKGDRIAQLVFVPFFRPEIIESYLNSTDREEGGFGSTGS